MNSDTYDIQELVSRSGVPRRTIHFYVQQGILPPPQGAGLAAHYTEDHLLRLQLIPVLRGQGLRLDQIRARFGQWDTDAMRKVLEEAQQAAPQPPKPSPRSLADDRSPYDPLLPGMPITPVTPVTPSPTVMPGWGEERIIQYRLPGGIIISAPDGLNPADRQKLELLLQAARRIFNQTRHVLHKPGPPKNGPKNPSTDFSEE